MGNILLVLESWQEQALEGKGEEFMADEIKSGSAGGTRRKEQGVKSK